MQKYLQPIGWSFVVAALLTLMVGVGGWYVGSRTMEQAWLQSPQLLTTLFLIVLFGVTFALMSAKIDRGWPRTSRVMTNAGFAFGLVVTCNFLLPGLLGRKGDIFALNLSGWAAVLIATISSALCELVSQPSQPSKSKPESTTR
jgi:hypothetical protein